MGYGITDLKNAKGWFDDPRLNSNSVLLDNDALLEKYESDEEAFTAYVEYLKALPRNRDAGLERGKELEDLVNAIDKEFALDRTVWFEPDALKRILLVNPISAEKYGWIRQNDAIDYAELAEKKAGYKPSVKMLKKHPAPYNNRQVFVDKSTGEIIEDQAAAQDWHDMIRGGFDSYPYNLRNSVAVEMGFSDMEEALQKFSMDIPKEIKNLVTWGQMFSETRYMYDLKPMIYTFWA